MQYEALFLLYITLVILITPSVYPFISSLGIFEFLQTLYVQLSTTWKQCIEWMKAKTSPPPYSAEADKKKDLSLSCSVLTKELILSVQRVMTRHRAVQSDREKNKGTYVYKICTVFVSACIDF